MLVRQWGVTSLLSECIDLTARGCVSIAKGKSLEDAEDESVSMRLTFKFRYFTGSAFIRSLGEIRSMGAGYSAKDSYKRFRASTSPVSASISPTKQQKNRIGQWTVLIDIDLFMRIRQ